MFVIEFSTIQKTKKKNLLDKQKADEQEKAHKRKAEALESLELELARVHLEAEKALQEKERYDRQLQDLLKGIEKVFK